jgi:putative FmdB family regulatory protein
MPYYEYVCMECGKRFEALQSFEEHDRHQDHERHEPLKCPKCGSAKVEQHIASSVYVVTSKNS